MMKKTPLLLLIGFMVMPVLALAQTSQEARDNSLLPEINPQDIEIRSEFRASFPGLRRQPILGFNPTPRVYQIEADRMPYMESRADAVADISVTQLGRPEPPAYTLLNIPDRTKAYIRAGFGSYITPVIEAYGFHAFNEKRRLTGNLNLRSSEGHLSDDQGGFRYMDVNARFVEKTSDKWQMAIDVNALADQNYLPYPSSNNIAFNETPDKEYAGASGKITVQKVNNSFSGMKYMLGGSVFDADLNSASSSFAYRDLPGNINEKNYVAGFQTYWPGARQYETFDVSGGVKGGVYEQSSGGKENWVHADAAFTYERLFNFETKISGSAGLDFVSDAFSDAVYFSPEINVRHYLTPEFLLKGKAFASPEMKTVQHYHEYNRLLNTETQLQHAYTLGLQAEAAYQLIEGNRFFAGVNYHHTKNYAYFQRDSVFATNEPAFYDVQYGDAHIFELYVGGTQQLVPETLWANLKFYGRSPKLAGGADIPYEERLGGDLGLFFRPVKELELHSWAEYTGKRRAPAATEKLDAFLLMNFGAEYQINDTFGVYAKLLNILGQQYEVWHGYEERPMQIFGGLTIKL